MEDLTQLVKEAEALGCRAGLADVAQVSFEPAFRDACASNACGNYGRCWTCPPDVGEIHDLIAQAQTYDQVLVYQTVGQLEDSYDFEGMMEAAKRHNQLYMRLDQLFRGKGFSRMLHLGAGGCHLCEVCAKKTGEPCRHPNRAVASLEAYGVNVSALARLCGMKYINGENTVTYFGALFFCP